MIRKRIWPGAILLLTLTGCMSGYLQTVGGDTKKVYERIYYTDFDTAWQSTLDVLKNNMMDISNREGGFIQTKWVDNTAAKNFAEAIGNSAVFLKAQYRVQVSLSKGYFHGRRSIKLSVLREQLVQRDVLEGWKPIESDGIEERTLLYRIGRVILVRAKLAKLEEEKAAAAAAAAAEGDSSSAFVPENGPTNGGSGSPPQ